MPTRQATRTPGPPTPGPSLSVAWSPDGLQLASGAADATVRLWGHADAGTPALLKGQSDAGRALAWSPDGTQLATAGATIWDRATGRVVHQLRGHTDGVMAICWSPDGSRLATASRDKTVRIWDARSGALLRVLLKHDDWVWSVDWSPDGSRLASSGQRPDDPDLGRGHRGGAQDPARPRTTW